MRKELKKKIIDSGMSQVEIASRVGIQATRMSEIVRGWRDPGEELAKEIAKLLNCTVAEVLKNDKDKKV